MLSSNKKVRDILSGCEDLLNDFSLPEEHSQRFISIDLGNGNTVTSSPTITPGTNFITPGGNSISAEVDRVRSKRAWERAIDKYVASVLDEEKAGGGSSSSLTKDSDSAGCGKSGKSARSNRLHPDNHLLDALRIETASVSSIPHVKSDGHMVDDSSFEPIDPFGFDFDRKAAYNGSSDSKVKQRIRQYIKEEWKPITLISLVILVTIIISATLNSDSSGAGSDKPVNPVFAVDTESGIASSPTPTPEEFAVDAVGSIAPDPTLEAESESPTYFPTSVIVPTYLPTPSPFEPESKIATLRPSAMVTTLAKETAPPTAPKTASPIDPETAPPSVSVVPTSKRQKETAPPTAPKTASPIDPETAPPSVSVVPTSKPASDGPTMPANYNEMKEAAMYVSDGKGFDNNTSPQSLAFDWLFYEGNPSTNLLEFFEQYAVSVLYFSLTKARTSFADTNSEVVFDEWTKTKEICGWQGVRCAFNYTSEMVHVTDIILSNTNLTGTIPNEISFLPKVKRLDLSDNEVSGTVPNAIYGMQRLRHLFLNNNKLEGTIPPAIDNLHLAEQIYLGQNNFVGTLPSNIGTKRPNKWRFFSVYDNQLSGPIPEGMRLKELFLLDLSRNEFYGTIPSDISQQNYTMLRLLYLDHNKLTGTIPGALMQILKLKGLFLNDNLLEGMIPYDIAEQQKYNLMTIRAQHNLLTLPVAPDICDLDVTKGTYELVELGVDCDICSSDCRLCSGHCY